MPPIREAVELEVLFIEYIEQCRYGAGLSPVTIRGYQAVFALFLKLMPEVTTVELLNHEMLVEFFKRLETRERIVGRNTVKTGVKKYVRPPGDRHLGGHRGGGQQAVRLHEVPAGTGSRRPLHPDRSFLPVVEGPRGATSGPSSSSWPARSTRTCRTSASPRSRGR